MPIRLVDLTADRVDEWLNPALTVYVTAMAYPLGTAIHRAPLWREHITRPGWRALGAVSSPDSDPSVGSETLVGVAYGYHGASDQWWNQQLRRGLASSATESEITDDYFELTELHVHPQAQGHGIGRRLLRELLRTRPEPRVLLSTPESPGESNNAWRLYRSLGFDDVLRNFTFAGDPRQFAVLGRSLPLPSEQFPTEQTGAVATHRRVTAEPNQ